MAARDVPKLEALGADQRDAGFAVPKWEASLVVLDRCMDVREQLGDRVCSRNYNGVCIDLNYAAVVVFHSLFVAPFYSNIRIPTTSLLFLCRSLCQVLAI